MRKPASSSRSSKAVTALTSSVCGKWHSLCKIEEHHPPRWMNPMTYEHTEELYLHRNKSVAKSFYRQLKGEGFTHQQIIELSTTLLDLVTEDLREEVHPH